MAKWCELSIEDITATPLYYASNLYFNGELVSAELVIPEGVKKISEYSFYNYKHITRVKLPTSVTEIRKFAFFLCTNLTDINIDENICYIGMDAISQTSLNTEIISGVEYLQNWAIDYYNHFAENMTPTLKDGTKGIAAYAFSDSDIESIIMPNSVEYICNNAFYNSDLKEISIHENIKYIGQGAFAYCKLNTITVASANSHYYIKNNCLIEKDTHILLAAVYGSNTIPDEVTEIGDYAFSFFDMTSVILPDGVTTIGSAAFCYCEQLATITIPNSIINIEWVAFENCPLTDIYYQGSISKWNSIDINHHWSDNERPIIHCSDGYIDKAGFEILTESNT